MKAAPHVLALALLATARAPGGDLPVNAFAVAPGDEEQTLLFIGTGRPALIRLRIQVDGQGHRARWEVVVRGMVKFFDTDGDGALSRQEVARVDAMRLPARAVRQAAPAGRPPVAGPASDRFDVSDLADKIRGFAPAFSIRSESTPEAQGADVFATLDRDKDGRLGRDEIAAAPALLERLDVDDDEAVSARELAPYRNPFFANRAVNQATMTAGGGAPSGPDDIIADASPAARARAILRRYDAGGTGPGGSAAGEPLVAQILKALASPPPRPRDDRLDRGEIALDRASFDRVDLDGDGGLDPREIERGLATVPDVELIVRLGRRDPWRAAVDVDGAPGARPAGVAIGRLGDGGVLIDLGSSVIELRADDDTGQFLATQKTVFLTQVRTYDADKNGILDGDEARQSPVLSRVFGVADGDGDGRLAEAELTAYFDFQAEVAGLRAVLRAIDLGGSVLDLLDADRDRRIGLRELRSLPSAIRREDRDGDGYVTPREIVRHYRWVVGRDEGSGVLTPGIAGTGRVAAPAFPPPPSAPTWFLKMDRNRDGDLSPREFLGPSGVFAAYDADADGLISPAEARRSPPAGAGQ
jgi:Ca2+-binding EF-hand superfamily protein